MEEDKLTGGEEAKRLEISAWISRIVAGAVFQRVTVSQGLNLEGVRWRDLRTGRQL